MAVTSGLIFLLFFGLKRPSIISISESALMSTVQYYMYQYIIRVLGTYCMHGVGRYKKNLKSL